MESVYLRHFTAYLTLIFFVILTEDLSYLNQIIISSLSLYIVFLFLINTHVNFFLICCILLLCLYSLDVYDRVESKNLNEKTKKIHKTIRKVLKILFFIFLVIGFILYMGEKKIEYKDDFNYITFIFGKPVCRNISPDLQYKKFLKTAFT
tara:strand:- start:3127 stop:3576 length:450 start_codon:yes stop_codon:yes gene_type:complete